MTDAVDDDSVLSDQELREEARAIYGSDDIEIDDNASVSRCDGEPAAWVQAWVYVRYDVEPDPEEG